PRPLRGPILARPSPTRAHDNDRLPLPDKKRDDLGGDKIRNRLLASPAESPGHEFSAPRDLPDRQTHGRRTGRSCQRTTPVPSGTEQRDDLPPPHSITSSAEVIRGAHQHGPRMSLE